ncbi:MAG: type II secretion system protein [Ectothiorhodospiraceae bacterium]|nr:type II secretion system protein [Chromatiales bacterium]MCP5155045.1 type II secretion system protein [Ectothiorhodospiraceae bacterium]
MHGCCERPPPRRRARGATLIELVLTIVVLSVALVGVLAVSRVNTARSADPVLLTQAQAVARAYLEEVLLRDYVDPDGSDAGETRATFDDVDDYHGLAANGCTAVSAACPAAGSCACDQFGEPVDALSGYQVSVAVSADTLNGAAARRVDVTVTHPGLAGVAVALSGYRASY